MGPQFRKHKLRHKNENHTKGNKYHLNAIKDIRKTIGTIKECSLYDFPRQDLWAYTIKVIRGIIRSKVT